MLERLSGSMAPQREHVVFQNSLAVATATRYLFGPSSTFEIADEMLADAPGFGNPRRPRMSGIDGR
jgi:hypothetical protein